MHALNVMSEINVALCAQLKTTSLVSLCQTTLSFVHFFFFFLHQISGQAEFSLSCRVKTDPQVAFCSMCF